MFRYFILFIIVSRSQRIANSVTGFLNGKNARIFMGELWTHMMSAQENIGGIPADFLEKKKEEIRQRKVCIGHS